MRSFSKTRNCAICTHKHKLFGLLTDEELNSINESRIEINYKRNETIVKESTPSTHFISFNRGLVKMSMEGKDRELITQFIVPPDFYVGPGIFTDKRNHYTLTAIEDTSACLIDLNVFLSVLVSNKEFLYEYLKYQCNRELILGERMLTLTQKQMHGRIANALLYLNEDIFTKNGSIINLLKTDLANFTSMNKDSVGRVLKEFHEGGLIQIDGNTIKLTDINILRQISEYG